MDARGNAQSSDLTGTRRAQQEWFKAVASCREDFEEERRKAQLLMSQLELLKAACSSGTDADAHSMSQLELLKAAGSSGTDAVGHSMSMRDFLKAARSSGTEADGHLLSQRELLNAACSGGTDADGHSKSFLNPTGATASSPPPKTIGILMELVVFSTFVIISAFKLIVTDASKRPDPDTGKKAFRYQPNSTIVLTSVLLAIVSVILCLAIGGKVQFATIWQRKPLLIFSMSGIAFALGDSLQMASMSSLGGASYQIMMQSRIIITAALLICIKGVYQTRLQWILLFIVMLSMSAYMVIESSATDQGGDVPVLGILLALLKTLVSCTCSVVIDKYTKVYKDDPTHVQLARISIARSLVLVLFSFTGEVWKNGFFSGWDSTTCVVIGGFFAKEVSTLYITALLDSVLRNIGEAFSVPVIYAHDVLAPWSDKSFDTSTFLAVLAVVAGCVAYVDSKVPIEKAAKYDELEQGTRRHKAS